MDMEEILGKIRDYADTAIDKLGKVGKSAASKTESTVSKAKLKYGITETESKIKNIYTVMGEKVYKKYLANGEICDNMADDCKKIDDLNEELEELSTKLSELKEVLKCDECGAFCKNDSLYCPKCGAKLAEEKIVTDEPVLYNDYEEEVITVASAEEV